MKRIFEHIPGFLIGIFTFGLYRVIDISIHHYMTDSSIDCKAVIKASFVEFRKEFEKADWHVHCKFRKSLFTQEHDSEFHASIICINNVGYKLTSYGFIRANILRRKKIKELNGRLASHLLHKNSELLTKED